MKVIFYWVFAVILTLTAIIYQRKTGPTYEKRVNITIDEIDYKLKLLRSHGGNNDAKIQLAIPDSDMEGKLIYRLFPTTNEWTEVKMMRENDFLVAFLPHLPPAGKYEYKVLLSKNNRKFPLNDGNPVLIRFKGNVPAGILIPHIFLMFFAMLLGNLAGIMAAFKHGRYKLYTSLTLIILFAGGLILGPWVQYHAFGEVWAGVPFAWDLTDNKTLIAFIFWLLAFIVNRKKERPVYTIVAAVVMLLVYSIPHSMYGSELNPETGEIVQGFIGFLLM